MTANFINMITVIIGSLIGLLLKKGIPQRISLAAMTGIGVCTVYIGYTGAMSGENVLIVIAAMIIGSVIGTLLDIDGKINSLGEKLEAKFKWKDNKGNLAKGFGYSIASILCWFYDYYRCPAGRHKWQHRPFNYKITSGFNVFYDAFFFAWLCGASCIGFCVGISGGINPFGRIYCSFFKLWCNKRNDMCRLADNSYAWA